MSARVIADERFQSGVLTDLLARMKGAQRPSIIQPELPRAEALIMLRTAEDAMQRKSSDDADREVEDADKAVRSSLSVIPTDSFLWLMLYSVETARNGFNPEHISYLEQSYAAGPLEGWIALRRNWVALTIFPVLSDFTQRRVVSEFAALVDSDFTEEAAMNLMRIGWSQRERLLTALEGVDIASRKSLMKRLSADGVKLLIPGIEYDERPWRR
ncbi:hypothetical protein [Bradyrhizobium sp. Ai1a-2]|uniref:hypothetical protein n=1 Tax=Bradyrhizobium sp. Ai1a-2 TaxID=196490 RepID=UPI0013647CB9|nr:hypothetical protein [Bradyrhizobium sp. Ai1a-2]